MNQRPEQRDKKPVVGLCPIGKFVFSHEDALRWKSAIEKKFDSWGIAYRTIDEVLPDGMVRDQKHVGAVVEHFRKLKVDALFMPHCNFGTEGAVGMIGKQLGVPVLLWGPRDEAPLADGSRLRDSLCGMFASSKVLHKLNVPFTYIENCHIDDPKFYQGVSLFLRAASVVKAMHRMRIAQVGVRIDFFWSTIENESELLERFGVEVFPVDMANFLQATIRRANRDHSKYAEELESLSTSWLDLSAFSSPKEGLMNSLAMRDEMFDIAESEGIDAFALKSFDSISKQLGAGTGLAEILVQERYPIAAESDVHGAISSVLLEAASNEAAPSFFPEFTVRHPENENAILLWHAAAPLSLRHPKHERVHFLPPWILKNLPPNSLQFRLKDGPLTVCRFDGDGGEYYLGAGQGATVDGPATREVYVWMEVDNWPHWERTLIEGPYIHHCSAIYDHCADALEEGCKYLPNLKFQRFDDRAQNRS